MIESILFFIATLTGGALLGGSLCLWLVRRDVEKFLKKRRSYVIDVSSIPTWFAGGSN